MYTLRREITKRLHKSEFLQTLFYFSIVGLLCIIVGSAPEWQIADHCRGPQGMQADQGKRKGHRKETAVFCIGHDLGVGSINDRSTTFTYVHKFHDDDKFVFCVFLYY